MFFSRKQLEAEPVDKWVTDLKRLSSACEFWDLRDSLVKDAIVIGVQDRSVKDRQLRERELDISKAIEICKIPETSKQQLKDVIDIADTPTFNVDAVKEKTSDKKQNNTYTCRYCGSRHPPRNMSRVW